MRGNFSFNRRKLLLLLALGGGGGGMITTVLSRAYPSQERQPQDVPTERPAVEVSSCRVAESK